ncbi:MAG: BUG/TctC family periplasmic protein, partial [uncultured Craurococcus sp.]
DDRPPASPGCPARRRVAGRPGPRAARRPAPAHHRRLRSRRHLRHRRPRRRRGGRRPARPAPGGGEPHRRQWLHRRRGRGPRPDRRLHRAAMPDGQHDHQPGSAGPAHSDRCRAGPGAGGECRPLQLRRGDRGPGAPSQPRGAAGGRPNPPRRAQLRQRRHRHGAAPLGRAVEAHGRGGHRPCLLSRRGAGGTRPHRRADRPAHHQSRRRHPPGAGRRAAPPGPRRRGRLAGIPRCPTPAPHRPRARGDRLVRHLRAPRHAARGGAALGRGDPHRPRGAGTAPAPARQRHRPRLRGARGLRPHHRPRPAGLGRDHPRRRHPRGV